jgi:hypothetical protein
MKSLPCRLFSSFQHCPPGPLHASNKSEKYTHDHEPVPDAVEIGHPGTHESGAEGDPFLAAGDRELRHEEQGEAEEDDDERIGMRNSPRPMFTNAVIATRISSRTVAI